MIASDHKSTLVLSLLLLGQLGLLPCCGRSSSMEVPAPAGGSGEQAGEPEAIPETSPPQDVNNETPHEHESPEADEPSSGETASEQICQAGYLVQQISGSLIGEHGDPVDGAAVQACLRAAATGQPICLRPVFVDAEGTFVVALPDGDRCLLAATLRALVPRGNFATTYRQVPSLEAGPDLRLDTPLVLYATTSVRELPAGDEQEPRMVVYDDHLSVEVTPYDFFGEYSLLAGTRLPAEQVDFVGSSFAGRVLYGFSPEGAIIGSGFPLLVASTQSPGTLMTLWVLGGLNCTLADGTHVPEGQWVAFDEVPVGHDGTVVSRLPCFTWIAYGPSPAAP